MLYARQICEKLSLHSTKPLVLCISLVERGRGLDVVRDVLAKLFEAARQYFVVQQGARPPWILTFGNHNRLVVGFIDAGEESRLVVVDPRWSEPTVKTLSKAEFVKLINAEYLGSGGFDPNAVHMQKGKTKY